MNDDDIGFIESAEHFRFEAVAAADLDSTFAGALFLNDKDGPVCGIGRARFAEQRAGRDFDPIPAKSSFATGGSGATPTAERTRHIAIRYF